MNMLYIIITESISNHYERKKSSFHSACRCGNELYICNKNSIPVFFVHGRADKIYCKLKVVVSFPLILIITLAA